MKKMEYTLQMCYNEDNDCNQMVTKRREKYLNRRIRKKKGLLKDQSYSNLKKAIFEKMEEKALELEQKSKK